MEPMNRFLISHRSEFKQFVDEVCAIPADRPIPTVTPSYVTPIQILGRLPVTSREGFPSLPFLIDHSRSFAVLTNLWFEGASESFAEISEYDPDILRFHNMALRVRQLTKDCLREAEQAERPSGDLEVKWEELLDSMEKCSTTIHEDDTGLDKPNTRPPPPPPEPEPPSIDPKLSSVGGGGSHRSSIFGSRLPLPRRSTDHPTDNDGDAPPNSASAGCDQGRVAFTMPRWSEPRESTGSSKNSSTYSLDYSDVSKGRRSSLSRESSSKYRFFDWGSKRKAKDREQYQSAPA